MKKKKKKIAQGTVYNNLNNLVKEGRIIRISASGFPDMFDNTTHHDHMICVKCGRLTDEKKKKKKDTRKQKTLEKITKYDLRVRFFC